MLKQKQLAKLRRESEKFPTPAYAANVLTDIFEDAKRLFLEQMIDVDRAHAVMLAEQRIITNEEAARLLNALDRLDRAEIRARAYDGEYEDLFFYLEDLVTRQCGADIAGRLHTARSRNDTDVTIYRMRLREDCLKVLRAAMDLRGVLLDIAAAHHETLMPAYTHTQPAQPSTLAHFTLAMAEVLGRDIKRLQLALININQSPLGACAITTTGFPINRERTAELLGFDCPTVNSYASIAAVDYLTETLSTVSVTMIDAGKFVQEFLQMHTREFGVLNLSDGYVQTSSIMPQKRNPVALEHVRVLASKSFGQAQAALVCTHNTPFGDINDVEDDLQPLVYNAMRDATRSLTLFAHAISTATFDTELLRRRAGEAFITITELADTIVRRENLPFRAAHTIVAEYVKRTTQRETLQDSALEFDENRDAFNLLQDCARSVTGNELSLTEDDLRNALDPANFVGVRSILGGCAPSETRRAHAFEREAEQTDEAWFAQRVASLAAYPQKIQEAAAPLTRKQV